MNIIYANESFPNEVTKSIFLAGPTPRDQQIQSWRPDAIKILTSLGYEGTVFIPEPKNGQFLHTYDQQIEWEINALKKADIILFWIPRNLETMPAFTTNIELGLWIDSGKVVIGFPKDSPKNRYIDYLAQYKGISCTNTLVETIQNALKLLGGGSHRINGECNVPLFIWETDSFQEWYQQLKKNNNVLHDAEVKWSFKVKEKVFIWVLHAKIFISKENRYKYNEFVISRIATSTVVMYSKGDALSDTKIVLVREFRIPSNNSTGYVWELPGGSSFEQNEHHLQVIQNEIREEIGLYIEQDRLIFEQNRQNYSTLLSNKVNLYSVELTKEEIEYLISQKGIQKGCIEDTEVTFVEIKTVQEILEENIVDWSNVGMIMKVLSQSF